MSFQFDPVYSYHLVLLVLSVDIQLDKTLLDKNGNNCVL